MTPKTKQKYQLKQSNTVAMTLSILHHITTLLPTLLLQDAMKCTI